MEHPAKSSIAAGKRDARSLDGAALQIIEQAAPLKHMELGAMLKSEHALGHGHANALVAAFLANK